jgi:hypothetical protein
VGGPASVTLTAEDDSAAQVQVPLRVSVEAARDTAAAPSVRAVAPVATDGRVAFPGTGVQIDVAGASGPPSFLTVDFFADADTSAPAATGFATVSPYRWAMASGALDLGDATAVRIRLGALPGTNGGIADPSTVTVLVDSTGTLQPLATRVDDGGTPGTVGDDVLIASGVSRLGTVRLASNQPENPLPVALTRFTAQQDGAAAVLRWATAAETRNAGFAVQHRPPAAATYATVGFVEGAGTTATAQQYRFRIADVQAGTHRFRLRQVDTDGTASLSEEVTLSVAAPRVLALSLRGPNPVRSGGTRAAFTVAQSGAARVALYNVLGQRVRVLYDGDATAGQAHRIDVPVARLPSGTYFLRLAAPSGTRSTRLVVVR